MKTILAAVVLLTALAAQADPTIRVPGAPGAVDPPSASLICRPGTAWTCTIICDPGSRSSIERVFNAPGTEACAVGQCTCQPLPAVVTPGARYGHPAVSAADIGYPIALVVFGVNQIIDGPGQP